MKVCIGEDLHGGLYRLPSAQPLKVCHCESIGILLPCIELASIITWDKSSNLASSWGQDGGPPILLWDDAPPQAILLYDVTSALLLFSTSLWHWLYVWLRSHWLSMGLQLTRIISFWEQNGWCVKIWKCTSSQPLPTGHVVWLWRHQQYALYVAKPMTAIPILYNGLALCHNIFTADQDRTPTTWPVGTGWLVVHYWNEIHLPSCSQNEIIHCNCIPMLIHWECSQIHNQRHTVLNRGKAAVTY